MTCPWSIFLISGSIIYRFMNVKYIPNLPGCPWIAFLLGPSSRIEAGHENHGFYDCSCWRVSFVSPVSFVSKWHSQFHLWTNSVRYRLRYQLRYDARQSWRHRVQTLLCYHHSRQRASLQAVKNSSLEFWQEKRFSCQGRCGRRCNIETWTRFFHAKNITRSINCVLSYVSSITRYRY